MKTIYHLSNCSTCQRIITTIGVDDSWNSVDIKADGISSSDIDKMFKLSGSYEALFSRRAMKYRAMGLQDKNLSETDYRSLILEEYTFLKRPVVIIGNDIFIGNSKKNVEAIQTALN